MRRLLAGLALMSSIPAVGHAQTTEDDPNLALIPRESPPAPVESPARTARSNGRIYLEDAFSAAGRRDERAAVVPAGSSTEWFDLLFADARIAQPLSSTWTLNYSGRANLQVEKDAHLDAREKVRLDTREAYLSWAIQPGWFLDIGRINLKSGVALGYNPTDFFKTRAVVEALSFDPSVQREDRLGTLMLRAQVVWARAALTLAYAPRLYRPTPLYSNQTLPSLDPMLDRTNAADRWMLKVSAKVSDDFSPELLAYGEGGRATVGLNLTRGVGRSVVLYAEWAGGRRYNLIAQAEAYARATGTPVAEVLDLLPIATHPRFTNSLALGASYTTASKIVFNLEFHHNGSGLSRSDWRRWFALGQAQRSDPHADAALWYLRAFAADQGEPASRDSAFVRVDRQNAFVRNLELSALANVDPSDRSGFAEAEADYFLSGDITIGSVARISFGSRRSEFGSQPEVSSLLLKVARYF